MPRRSRDGRVSPGVIYVEALAFGDEARECAERVRQGSRVGLSGRLDDDPPEEGIGILIEQLDFP